MFDELHSFSLTEVLVLSAIAKNHEMIENSKYKKSFQHQLDGLLIDIDKIESRKWRPADENNHTHMLACDLRLRVHYNSINAGIKIDTDTSEELKEFLLQDEFDVIVHNDVPGYLYFYTANAIANVGALIGLARMQKMFHEIFQQGLIMNHSNTSQQIPDQQPEGILKAIESLIGTDDLLYYGPDEEANSIKEGIIIYRHETPFGVKFRCGQISHRGGISGSAYFEHFEDAFQYCNRLIDVYASVSYKLRNVFSQELREKVLKRIEESESKTYWKIFKDSSHLFY